MTKILFHMSALWLLASPLSALASDCITIFPEPNSIHAESGTTPSLEELKPIDDYLKQPAWTSAHRFTFSDVYVLRSLQGAADLSFGADPAIHSPPGSTNRISGSLQLGLLCGWQVDILGSQGDIKDDSDYSKEIQVRKAIAPWGSIWGNPTLVASYASRDGDTDTLKFRVLLGGNMAPRWTWSLNSGYERTYKNNDIGLAMFSGGILYSIKDNLLAIGAEVAGNVLRMDAAGPTDARLESTFIGIGPSIAWTPELLGLKWTIHGAALLLTGRAGDNAIAPHDCFSIGLSCRF